MFPLFSFSQTKQIDSLKKALPLLHDNARIDCLNEIGNEYILLDYNTNDYTFPYSDSVSYYVNTSYEEAKSTNYIHGLAESLCLKAAIYNRYLKNFKEAEKMAQESLKWFELTNNKKRIEIAYFQVARSLFPQHRYDEASPYLEQSYNWSEKNGNKYWMFFVLEFKYENYRDVGDYGKAFDAFQKTQQLNLASSGHRDMWYEFYVLAELQRRIGNFSIALDYYRKVVDSLDLQNSNIWFRVSYPELFALTGKFDSAKYYYNLIDSSKLNKHDLRFYLVSIGEFYLSQKEFRKALGLLLNGLNYHREATDITQVNRALLNVAKTYAALEHDRDALVYTHEALEISLRSHSKQFIRDAYEILYNIYQRRHEPDSAFSYYQKYVTQKEIVETDVVKGQFAAYNYEQTIELLDKEKQIQEVKLRKEFILKKLLIAGILVLILLAAIAISTFIYILFRYRLLQRIKLLEMRNQISQDLHDEIGSTLTSINILSKVSQNNLEKDKSKASELLQKISEQSADMQQSMSDIVWSIRPDNDKMENLVIRMREYLGQTAEARNMQVQFSADEKVLNENLSMQHRQHIFLIFKEAVNNAVKYSGGKTVTIFLGRENSHIRLSVKDDGSGFQSGKNTSSNGLKNMQARANELNGTLHIRSEDGKGTEVELICNAT